MNYVFAPELSQAWLAGAFVEQVLVLAVAGRYIRLERPGLLTLRQQSRSLRGLLRHA